MSKNYRLTRISDVREVKVLGLELLSGPFLGKTSRTIRSRNDLDVSAKALSSQNAAASGATHYMFTELSYEDMCCFLFYGPVR